MKCPNCQNSESKVVESRDVAAGESIRRRRECLNCQTRFTTYERLERPAVTVVKKDGSRQLFDRAKLIRGLQKACEKTAVGLGEAFDELAGRIENAIYAQAGPEISSQSIGRIVMDELAKVNQVAYVRFASVYRNFTDIESFQQELLRIKRNLEQKSKQKEA